MTANSSITFIFRLLHVSKHNDSEMLKHGGDMQRPQDTSDVEPCKQTLQLPGVILKLRSGCAHLAQLFRVLMQLFQDGQSLLLSAVLQNPLDHSAPIRMGGKDKNLQNKGISF